MEAQGKNMRTECFQVIKNPLYWLITGLGLAARTVLAYFDGLYRGPQFWELALDFWDKTGSVTIGFLILLVMIRCFSYDIEVGVFSVVNSTAYGRLHLLLARLTGGSLAVALSVILLYGGNTGISLLLGNQIEVPYGWMGSFIYKSMISLVGAAGFYIVSALVCDLAKNQPIAMCLCGLPFASSYFINSGAVTPPDVFWLLKYGFFTELMRGSTIQSLPQFWLGWYLLLIGMNFFFVMRKRKENREL